MTFAVAVRAFDGRTANHGQRSADGSEYVRIEPGDLVRLDDDGQVDSKFVAASVLDPARRAHGRVPASHVVLLDGNAATEAAAWPSPVPGMSGPGVPGARTSGLPPATLATLRTWATELARLLDRENDVQTFRKLKEHFEALFSWHRRAGAPPDVRAVVDCIQRGNLLCGINLPLTESGTVVFDCNAGPLELFDRHRLLEAGAEYREPSVGLADQEVLPHNEVSRLAAFQARFQTLRVDIRACLAGTCLPNELVEISVALFDPSCGATVSDWFSFDVDHDGKTHNGQTVTTIDFVYVSKDRRALMLVFRLARIGILNSADPASIIEAAKPRGELSKLLAGVTMKDKGHYTVRRPLGFGSFNLSRIAGSDDAGAALWTAVNVIPFSSGNSISYQSKVTGTRGADTVGFASDATNRQLLVSAHWLPSASPPLSPTTPIARSYPSDFNAYLPTEKKNSVYVTVVRGDFARHRNVEVTVEARDSMGRKIEGVISERNTTMVIQNTLSPAWNDTFRLDIPIELFKGAHILLICRNQGSRGKGGTLFALAALSLVNSRTGTVLADGERVLHCLKAEDARWPRPAEYLEVLDNKSKLTEDDVYVRTKLVSTHLTQDAGLANFLRWKQLLDLGGGLVPMSTVVNELFAIPQAEIVKFSGDILDALVEMIVDEHGELESRIWMGPNLTCFAEAGRRVLSGGKRDLLLHALVHVLGVLSDVEFGNHYHRLSSYLVRNDLPEDLPRALASCLERFLRSALAQPSDLVTNELERVLSRSSFLVSLIRTGAGTSTRVFLSGSVAILADLMGTSSDDARRCVFNSLHGFSCQLAQALGWKEALVMLMPIAERQQYSRNFASELAKLSLLRRWHLESRYADKDCASQTGNALLHAVANCLVLASDKDLNRDDMLSNTCDSSLVDMVKGVNDLAPFFSAEEMLAHMLEPTFAFMANTSSELPSRDLPSIRTAAIPLILLELLRRLSPDQCVRAFESRSRGDRNYFDTMMKTALLAANNLKTSFSKGWVQLSMLCLRASVEATEIACAFLLEAADLDIDLAKDVLLTCFGLLENGDLAVNFLDELRREAACLISLDRSANVLSVVLSETWKAASSSLLRDFDLLRSILPPLVRVCLAQVEPAGHGRSVDMLAEVTRAQKAAKDIVMETLDGLVGEESTVTGKDLRILAANLQQRETIGHESAGEAFPELTAYTMILSKLVESGRSSSANETTLWPELISAIRFRERHGRALAPSVHLRRLLDGMIGAGNLVEAGICLSDHASTLKWGSSAEEMYGEAAKLLEEGGEPQRALEVSSLL